MVILALLPKYWKTDHTERQTIFKVNWQRLAVATIERCLSVGFKLKEDKGMDSSYNIWQYCGLLQLCKFWRSIKLSNYQCHYHKMTIDVGCGSDGGEGLSWCQDVRLSNRTIFCPSQQADTRFQVCLADQTSRCHLVPSIIVILQNLKYLFDHTAKHTMQWF